MSYDVEGSVPGSQQRRCRRSVFPPCLQSNNQHRPLKIHTIPYSLTKNTNLSFADNGRNRTVVQIPRDLHAGASSRTREARHRRRIIVDVEIMTDDIALPGQIAPGMVRTAIPALLEHVCSCSFVTSSEQNNRTSKQGASGYSLVGKAIVLCPDCTRLSRQQRGES